MFGGKTAEGIVGFGSETDGSGKGEGDGFASVATFRVDFTNVQLDGSVVLGGDETVSSRAEE